MYSARLKQLKRTLKLNTEQIAHALDMPARTFGSYERGESKVPLELLTKLCNKYSVNPEWFTLGQGEMFVNQTENTLIKCDNSAIVENIDRFHKRFNKKFACEECLELPVRGDVCASLGYGVTIYNEAKTGTYSISKQLAHDLGINTNTSEIIFASGNSMTPTIEGGDSLLIDLTKKEVYDGRIYCVRIDGQLYAKRLQKIPPNKIVVISDNQQYKSFDIDFSKDINFDFEIIGEVRWWGRIAK